MGWFEVLLFVFFYQVSSCVYIFPVHDFFLAYYVCFLGFYLPFLVLCLHWSVLAHFPVFMFAFTCAFSTRVSESICFVSFSLISSFMFFLTVCVLSCLLPSNGNYTENTLRCGAFHDEAGTKFDWKRLLNWSSAVLIQLLLSHFRLNFCIQGSLSQMLIPKLKRCSWRTLESWRAMSWGDEFWCCVRMRKIYDVSNIWLASSNQCKVDLASVENLLNIGLLTAENTPAY